MLINLNNPSPVHVIMCSMSVPICNHFHIKLTNNYLSLKPSFEGNPFTQWHEVLSLITRVLGAAHSEDFVILVCTVLIQITSVTDKQTDGRTHQRWLKRAKHYMLSRVKIVRDFMGICCGPR